MTWGADSARRARLPRDWPAVVARILARDRRRCQVVRVSTGAMCGRPATDVDHIVPGDNHDDSNLQAICRWHHRAKSSREGNDAQQARRDSKYRKSEQHPSEIAR